MPDPAVPAGTVAEVMQEGYQIGDRVLRAALVGVSKGAEQRPERKPAETGRAAARAAAPLRERDRKPRASALAAVEEALLHDLPVGDGVESDLIRTSCADPYPWASCRR